MRRYCVCEIDRLPYEKLPFGKIYGTKKDGLSQKGLSPQKQTLTGTLGVVYLKDRFRG